MGIEKDFIDSCKEMETGKEYAMPQWASFLAMLSVVITRPVGYLALPIIICLLAMVQYAIEEQITIKVLGGVALVTLSYFIFVVSALAANMAKQGTLESYMAYIYANNRFPIWLRNTFAELN